MAYEYKCPQCGAKLDVCEKHTADNVIPFSDIENAENECEGVKSDDMIFYNVKDVARVMNISIPTARGIMHRHDFPLVGTEKRPMVSKAAFEKWTMERRV